MLEKITLHNFQIHKDITLDLVPGVNIITGTSRAGKSSIIRAVKWIITNRPVGLAFKNRTAEDGIVKGSLVFDGTKVERKRSKTANEYKLGKQKFSVVKTDVPSEVSDFINLDEVNLQSQHDQYFLLQSSAGEVAKKLNQVANLEIIDFVLGEVNSEITSANKEIQRTKTEIDSLKAELKVYDGLNEIEILASEITQSIQLLEEKQKLFDNLTSIITNITESKEEIKAINSWLEVEKDAAPVFKALDELAEKRDRQWIMNKIVEDVQKATEEIETLNSIMAHDSTVKSILADIEKYTELDRTAKLLSKSIWEITENKNLALSLGVTIEKYIEGAVNLIEQEGLCPLCGGEIGIDAIEHVRSWL